MSNVKSHWPLSVLAAFSSLLNLGLPIVMARLLPAEEIGLFRLFFVYLLAIPNLAFSVGLINGLYFWAGKKEAGKNDIQFAGQLLYIVSFSIAIVLLVFYSQTSHFLGISQFGAVLFAIAAIPTILHIHYESVQIAKGNVFSGAVFSSVFEFLRASCMIFAVFYYQSFYAVIVAHLSILLLKLCLATVFSFQKGYLSFSFQKKALPAVLQYAAPVSLAALFDMLVTSSDRFLVSYFLEPAVFAVYMMGCLALPPLQAFEQSVNKVLIPQIAEKLHHADLENVKKIIRFSMEELMLIFIPATVGLITFAKPIILILFTEKYAQASSYLVLYALNYVLLGIPYDIYFRAAGNSKWILKNSILFGCASLFLAALLGWKFQAYGALIAILLVQASMRIRSMYITSTELRCTFMGLIPVRAILKYAVISTSLAVLSLLVRTSFTDEKVWFLVCGVLFTVLYFLVEFSKIKRVSNFIKTKATFFL